MNLFTKAINAVKDAVDSSLRKAQLDAGKKEYIAEREREIADAEARLFENVTRRNWAFYELLTDYETIQRAKEQIANAEACYAYIFDEIKAKK